MNDFLTAFTFRTILLFASSAFSMLFVMLLLNIITVDDVAVILKLSPEATNAFKLIISRVQEVSMNILDIISQLLTRLLDFAGIDVDLNKIKVDTHGGSNTSSSTGQ